MEAPNDLEYDWNQDPRDIAGFYEVSDDGLTAIFEADEVLSASEFTALSQDNGVRRTLNFDSDSSYTFISTLFDGRVGYRQKKMTRQIPRHLFPAIAASRGFGVEVQLTDAQVRRQAELDALVNSRVSVASPTVVDSDHATTVKRSAKRSRFLEEEFGRMMKRQCVNSVVKCVSCCGQHLVAANDPSITCVFCGHSQLEEVDCNVPEYVDDC